jgi:hypothetical protein
MAVKSTLCLEGDISYTAAHIDVGASETGSMDLFPP